MIRSEEQYDADDDEDAVVFSLLKHQLAFVEDYETKFIGLCTGFGSGKTEALVYKAIHLASINAGHMRSDQFNVLLEPTGIMVRTLLMPRIEKILEELQIPYTSQKSPVPTYTLEFEAGDVTIKCLSAQNTDRLVGFECAFFGVDEADTLSKDVMTECFQKLQGRMRGGKYRQGFVTSTPEGYNFLYQFFEKDGKDKDGEYLKDRKLYKGSPYDNPFLPADYIPNLLSQYPDQLIKAYLYGEFVNLNSGTVYYAFDRKQNDTPLTVEDFDRQEGKAVIHIGVDFNVNKTCGIVHCLQGQNVYAVDEITGMRNTEQLIEEIRNRYPNRVVIVYPDAAGRQQHTNASMSDIQMLKQYFEVKHLSKNPFVRDRVASVNGKFCNANGERSYFVNTRKCPRLVEALEQQCYTANGEPDKKHDQDHPVDGAGYFVWYKFPVVGRGTVRSLS